MPEGLSSEVATRKLRDAIEEEVDNFKDKVTWRTILHSALFRQWTTSSCWILILALLTVSICFAASPCCTPESIWRAERLPIVAVVLLLICILTVIVSVYFAYLRKTELERKVRTIVDEIDEILSEGVNGLTTASLYEPASESINVQWTFRDGLLVNLPWITLVEGDFILLRPGREIPCRCHSLENADSGTDLEPGQNYIPPEHFCADDQMGVVPFLPLLCKVDETPAASYVRACLRAPERPSSLMENEYGRIVHFYIGQIAIPVVFLLSIAAALFRYINDVDHTHPWFEIMVLAPIAVVLPLTAPMLSFYTLAFTLLRSAQFLQNLDDAEDADGDGELFAELESNSTKTALPKRRFRTALSDCFRTLRYFKKLALGDPSSLPLSANIVQTLGNITSLCVVDRKGLLSWANPTPEKVFFFSRARHRKGPHGLRASRRAQSVGSLPSLQDTAEQQKEFQEPEKPAVDNNVESERSLSASSYNKKPSHLTVEQPVTHRRSRSVTAGKRYLRQSHLNRVHAEVLDLTHDPYQAFVVHFDDAHWRTFLSSLKPLGLNILLNSCNLHSEYIRFVDHVHAISAVVPRTISVVNRRCLCYLAQAIGFNRTTGTNQFEIQQTLGAYRKTPGNLPPPGMIKHKTPLPNLFVSVVRDKVTGYSQLMCQGTADLISEACDYYWDGKDVKPLDRHYRKKISDFAQRNSMTAYCVAFSYRPVGCTINRSLQDIYVNWPTSAQSSRSESIDSAVSSEGGVQLIRSYDSLIIDEYFSSPPVDKPSMVLQRLLKGHVFLGMISLQYQAKPDVVRLVDSLEKACIRFVHYSKENELRSRIFAEKCGLEAGWNCHISLGKESEIISAAGSRMGSQQLEDARFSANDNRYLRSRFSVPNDMKVDFPLVQFTPLNSRKEPMPKVICISTDEMNTRSNASENDDADADADIDIDYDRSSVDDEDEEAVREAYRTRRKRLQRCASIATLSTDSIFADAHQDRLLNYCSKRERTPLLSDATSRTSVVTNHSSTNPPLAVPPNRARLPKGIENVRPHLENVDNVPLLVPLFTDCYPSAVVGMTNIMQDYGEVVCVIGSTLNFNNAEIFCQSNASVGIEPLRPAVCVKRTDRLQSETTDSPDSGLSSSELATSIARLPCSVWISAGGQINLLDMVAASRHRLATLRTSWLFYLAASLAVTVVQLMALVLALPRPLSGDLLAVIICISIPVLSGALCATPQYPNVLRTATPKNQNWVSKTSAKKFLTSFCFKFLPSVAFLVLWFYCSLLIRCTGDDEHDWRRRCQRNSSTNDNVTKGHIRHGWWWPVSASENQLRMLDQSADDAYVIIVQQAFAWLLVCYLCVISTGYVHYRDLLKDRLPFANLVWVIVVILLLVFQFLYAVVSIVSVFEALPPNDSDRKTFFPWPMYLCGLLWPLVVLPVNELLKRYDLIRYHRDQRRRRLSFGTKLGMNSPF